MSAHCISHYLGFVVDLGHNESLAMNTTAYLQNNDWLDRYTRSIFVEFVTYNPSVNMFCLVTLVTEIIPTGGYYQFSEIYPMRLYRYYGRNLLAIMILEIILATFLVYFAYREFKKWRREGRLYWRNPWNYTELVVLASCYSTIGLYFARMVATKFSISLMRKEPKSFVSFHYAATLDQWATFTQALAVFLSFLKVLRLLRFNRRMSFMTRTLKICFKPIASFTVVYLLVFVAYTSLGYLVFGRVNADYHTFHSSMSNVLGMTLGAFNYHALERADQILGPMFFFSFTFFVNFILVNLLVAIITEALARVTLDVSHQSNDHEIVDFMINQVKSYIGFRVSPVIKPTYVEPLTGVDESFSQITIKTEGVDTAFRNLCMEEVRTTSWLDPEKCENKKKLLLRLLLQVDDQLTESELCDSIPLLEEVIRAYTENDFKELLEEHSRKFDDSKTMKSLVFSSRATTSHDARDGNSSVSRADGRWLQVPGSSITLVREFTPHSDVALDKHFGIFEDDYTDRRLFTSESLYHTPSTAFMGAMNGRHNFGYVDERSRSDVRLFVDDDYNENEQQNISSLSGEQHNGKQTLYLNHVEIEKLVGKEMKQMESENSKRSTSQTLTKAKQFSQISMKRNPSEDKSMLLSSPFMVERKMKTKHR